MVGMLVGLTLFFLIGTLWQLWYLQLRIQRAPTLPIAELKVDRGCGPQVDATQCLSLKRMQIAAILESNIVARRYHQANMLLMSSVWSRYLGFTTGMIIALMGAAFILGQLKIGATSLEAGSTQGMRATLQSTSPGIVMCVLGVVLMVMTIVTLHTLNTKDTALYFSKELADADADPLSIYADAPKDEAKK